LYQTQLISNDFVYHSDTPITMLFIFALVVPHKAFDKGFSKSFGVTVTFPSSTATDTSSCISVFKVSERSKILQSHYQEF